MGKYLSEVFVQLRSEAWVEKPKGIYFPVKTESRG